MDFIPKTLYYKLLTKILHLGLDCFLSRITLHLEQVTAMNQDLGRHLKID